MDIKLNLSCYASIMPDAFKDLLCSKLCWHNRPVPSAQASEVWLHPCSGSIAMPRIMVAIYSVGTCKLSNFDVKQ